MKFISIVLISLALACIKGMPLASPVPCQGCVPSSAELVSPRSAKIDAEPILVTASSKSLYPGCVPIAPTKTAEEVAQLIEASEATSTLSDLRNAEPFTKVPVPTPACPGCVPSSAA